MEVLVLQTDLLSDVLMLLDEEHAMYRELLALAREQGRVLPADTDGRPLSILVALREDLYGRIDACERSSEGLITEFEALPEPVREVARAIHATIRRLLNQDRDNERLLDDLKRSLCDADVAPEPALTN